MSEYGKFKNMAKLIKLGVNLAGISQAVSSKPIFLLC